MVEIIWTDFAIDDINNIAEFISRDSEKYANIQVERFFDYAEILKTHPHAGRMVPEIGDEQIRELIEGNYRIIYKIISASEIHVLTIHHSKRLFENNPLFE